MDKISSQLPDGIYTTFRTFHNDKVLPLEPQFLRLEESARLLRKPILLQRVFLRGALREIVNHYHEQELRIRITVDLTNQPGAIYILLEKLKTPSAEEYSMGVNTVTWKAVRKNPKAKKTTFLYEAEKIRFEIPDIVNEVLLVNRKEQILEGLSSNFFAIHKGEIWTEGRQVLSGRTRAIILDVAATAGIRIHLAPIYISEIPNLEEAFLTSASRSVLPIQKINDCLVGTGKAGDVTNKLNVLYRQRI